MLIYDRQEDREREGGRESGAGTLNLKGYSRGVPLPLAIPVAPHYVAASKQFSIKSTITINKSLIVSRTSSSSSGYPTLPSFLSPTLTKLAICWSVSRFCHPVGLLGLLQFYGNPE